MLCSITHYVDVREHLPIRRRKAESSVPRKGGSKSSRDVIKAIEMDGWVLAKVEGSHHHFKHPEKPGKVTVPHPVKDMPIGTLKSIERQSGVKLR